MKDNNKFLYIAGVILIIMSVIYFWQRNNSRVEAFTNKIRCAAYTEKRESELKEKNEFLQHIITVEGFYSQIENTCITNSSEMAPGHYMQYTLIDELTGKVEAHAFKTLDLASVTADLKEEETRQDLYYGQRLRYFQGIK